MTNGKFIYVFDINARDKLLRAGYTMLAKDERNSIFVFLKRTDGETFSLNNIDHVISNTMSF